MGAMQRVGERPSARLQLARPRFSSAAGPIMRVGLLAGTVGGLLGALQLIASGIAIAVNQQDILLYEQQYDQYRMCQDQASTATCATPTDGVMAMNTIWLLFLVAGAVTLLLALVAYALAARAATRQTGHRTAGVSAALVGVVSSWLLYLVLGVAAVFAHASPFAMSAPPPGVDPEAVHTGAAIGAVLVCCVTLLPMLIVAALAGLLGTIGALRGNR